MNSNTIIYASVLLFGVFISSISQVLLKKAALKSYDNPIKEYLNPFVIIAYGIFFIATLLSVIAYKGIPLSMGPILETTSYLFITFFGIKFFREKLNKQKIIALSLIIIGIMIYSFAG